MSNDFKFKQFRILQDRCAMKVGTDGVLLGAWAECGVRILDVGTGTGLLAMMVVQRYPEAQVDAIDIDAEACAQARENADATPWASRIDIKASSLQDYARLCSRKYDTIISNPPFFVKSLKAPDARRSMARHADTLPFSALLEGVSILLDEQGVFSVVLPTEVFSDFESEAYLHSLVLSHKVMVRTKPSKPAKRVLACFRRQRVGDLVMEERDLMNQDGTKSDWYTQLTSEFYL